MPQKCIIKLYVCYDSHFKEDLDFMETKNISVQLSSQCIKIGGQSVHKSNIFSFTVISQKQVIILNKFYLLNNLIYLMDQELYNMSKI
jgi:hypothetical protein